MRKKYKALAAIVLFLMLIVGIFIVVYKKTNLFAKDEWIITQYGPRDINLSFYTLYNPKKGLIVVDGGWTEDAQYVRDIIALAGNKVDAWILTHPHQDHVGAFNVIYADPRDIEIGKVYTVDMASPKECIQVASWDSVEAYENFLELEVKDLQYLYTGDELEICGLQFQILNTYGEHVKQYSRDYLNDGSMMFKVKAKEQSMLFCADVGVSVSDYLLQRWGDTLQANYLQMGHHGYGGLQDDFYQKVAPQVAFFDAPAHMMLDDTGKYDNPENVRLMKDMGSLVYSFIGGPVHSVVLK